MKRKLCMILLSLCIACTAAGCGGKDASSKKQEGQASSPVFEGRLVSASEKELAKIVELGEYKGLAVDKTIEDVTDDQVEEQLRNILSTSTVEVEDPEAAAGEGDVVNINYTGTKDGTAFDGGTAEDYDLTLGSGQFIEGFEDGLIGAKKGETKELNLTFPEDYPNSDLSGQDVVFTVTVNAIKRIPELSDEWVKNNSEYDNIEDYKQGIREDLEASNQFSADSATKNEAWNQVLTNSDVKEYPDEDLDSAVKEYNDSINSYAEQMGQSVDEFLKAQNITQEQLDEESQQYAQYKLKQNLIVQAIMDSEGFTLDDEGCQKAASQMEKDYGMTLDDMIEQYGESTVKETIALTRVMDYLIENAEINTIAGSSDGKDGILADEGQTEDESENTEE